MEASFQTFSFVSESESDTRDLGIAIGRALLPGTLITLQGTLGAGKTNLVQAIAESLGVERRRVVSPTFALIQVYEGRLPLVHIDAYRIGDDDQYLELGIDEYLDGESVVAIEWAEKFSALLPGQSMAIEIAVLSETQREITIRWPVPGGNCQAAGQRIQDHLGGIR